MDANPFSFIDEPITAIFNDPPVIEKSPPCPDAFIWRGEEFRVVEQLEVWQDFKRRGRFARNMQPAHLASAARRGSWGVGRFHYRVRTAEGRIFQLYYDRAPLNAADRGGHWFLFGERKA